MPQNPLLGYSEVDRLDSKTSKNIFLQIFTKLKPNGLVLHKNEYIRNIWPNCPSQPLPGLLRAWSDSEIYKITVWPLRNSPVRGSEEQFGQIFIFYLFVDKTKAFSFHLVKIGRKTIFEVLESDRPRGTLGGGSGRHFCQVFFYYSFLFKRNPFDFRFVKIRRKLIFEVLGSDRPWGAHGGTICSSCYFWFVFG